MTPIERAVRSLEAFDGAPCIEAKHGCPGGIACPANAKEAVRAVLQAIREPSEAMSSSAECTNLTVSRGGEDSFDYLSKENAADVWRGMVDAALAE